MSNQGQAGVPGGRGKNRQTAQKRTTRPFAIDLVMQRIRDAIRSFPQAALFALAEEGFDSPFELLIACLISTRTLDEVTLACVHRLFARAHTPVAISQLTAEAIDEAIRGCTFHDVKARQIQEIARRVVAEHSSALPCDAELFQSFQGIGPKCANLVLGIACNQPHISVDVHVHRVTNRWGYVQTRTPERTMAALEGILPQQYWVEINRLLVPFGKHICTGNRPRCSTCPVLDMCQQVGVESHR
jgi:endonuclease III